jgi:hypothetical protein
MTAIGSRYLLIGGFDGKSTYGEPWWLVPQGIHCAYKDLNTQRETFFNKYCVTEKI